MKVPKPADLKWFLAAALILAVAFALKAGLIAYAMYALLAVLVLSRLMTYLWLSGIECTRELDRSEMNIGDEVAVIATVKNTRPWPIPWLFIEETVPEKCPVRGDRAKLVMLMPEQTTTLLYQVRFNQRGYYQIGPLVMESGDVFGLYRRFKLGKSREYVTVYPHVHVISEFQIGARRPQGSVRFANRIYEDPTRIRGVREYVSGDSLRRIHWKASAATGRWQSKVYEPSQVIGATVALDFHVDGYRGKEWWQRSELAVTTAASLAYYIFQAREQIGFFTNGRDAAERAGARRMAATTVTRETAHHVASLKERMDQLRPFQVETRRSEAQGLRILESLARAELTDGLTIDRMLVSETEHIRRDAALLVVVPAVTPELELAFAMLKSSGFSITVFVIMNQEEFVRVEAMLASDGIEVFHVERPTDLREIVTGKVYM